MTPIIRAVSYTQLPAHTCNGLPGSSAVSADGTSEKNLKAVIIGIVSGVLASLVSVLILAKAVQPES